MLDFAVNESVLLSNPVRGSLRTMSLNAKIKTSPGEGAYRKPLTRPRLVWLPGFTTLLLGRRRRVMPDNLLGVVFATRNGTWQQVNNAERRWRQIRGEAGLEWVTPDMFRRAVRGPPEPFSRYSDSRARYATASSFSRWTAASSSSSRSAALFDSNVPSGPAASRCAPGGQPESDRQPDRARCSGPL